MNLEIWKSIAGYEGRYEVSDQGRVRSLGACTNGRNGSRPFRKGRVLSPVQKCNGYFQVTLCAADGSRESCQVHQLVCSAFHERQPWHDQVRHFDECDKSNNRALNLRWGDAADNAADRERHGNFVSNLPNIRGY